MYNMGQSASGFQMNGQACGVCLAFEQPHPTSSGQSHFDLPSPPSTRVFVAQPGACNPCKERLHLRRKMEVHDAPSAVATPTSPPSKAQQQQYGLDSDDETLRFDNDDDLYSSDLDEVDARWVRKQHLPAADCGEEPPATGGGAGGRNGGGGRGTDDDNGNDNDYDDVEDDDDDLSAAAAAATATAAAGTPPAADDGTGGAGEERRENGGGAKQRRPQAKKKGRGRAMGVVSDAQLSCPLCFTTVCLECQRHALYYNQFRAVTGINIMVKGDESLTVDQLSAGTRTRQSRGGKGRRGNIPVGAAAAAATEGEEASSQAGGGQGGGGIEGVAEGGVGRRGGGGDEERFHPVCCGECDHRVGVVDEEEVLHFFNVIASG